MTTQYPLYSAALTTLVFLAPAFAATQNAAPPASQPAQTSRPAQASRPVQLPDGVQLLSDIEYARVADKKLMLDLYVPEQANVSQSPLPLLVWIHGGGWQGGDKAACPLMDQAALGYVVASINYRLSNEAKFPAQIEDCKAAIRFLRANAGKHNIDPQKIGVAGSSAGGHLAALLGTSGGVKDLEGNEGNLTQSSRVQAVVDFCGPIDFFKQVEYYAVKAAAAATQSGQGPNRAADGPVIRLLGGLPSEKKDLATKANPITHITRDDPPFLIIHGQDDKLVPPLQAQLLYDALKAAGVEARLILVPDAGHGMPGGKASLEAVERFFDRHLKNEAPASQALGKLGDYEKPM